MLYNSKAKVLRDGAPKRNFIIACLKYSKQKFYVYLCFRITESEVHISILWAPGTVDFHFVPVPPPQAAKKNLARFLRSDKKLRAGGDAIP